jgi:quercetin dioxygenase-like cupin family protein
MPRELDRRLRDQGLRPDRWGNGPGERYAAHQHGYDKVIAVERGSIRFRLPGSHATIELVAGDRLDLPAGTIHDAEVGPTGVACLEAHLPAGTLESPLRRPSGTW